MLHLVMKYSVGYIMHQINTVCQLHRKVAFFRTVIQKRVHAYKSSRKTQPVQPEKELNRSLEVTRNHVRVFTLLWRLLVLIVVVLRQNRLLHFTVDTLLITHHVSVKMKPQRIICLLLPETYSSRGKVVFSSHFSLLHSRHS